MLVKIQSFTIDADKVATISWSWDEPHITEEEKRGETGTLYLWFIGAPVIGGTYGVVIHDATNDDVKRLKEAMGSRRRIHLLRNDWGMEVARLSLDEIVSVASNVHYEDGKREVAIVLRSGYRLDTTLKGEDFDHLMMNLHWETPMGVSK